MDFDDPEAVLDLPYFWEQDGLILRQLPDDSVPYAYFERRVPNSNESKVIVEGAYGLALNQIPRDSEDLSILLEFPNLTHLDLISLNGDPRNVVRLRNLTDLHLVSRDVDGLELSELSHLRRFSGLLAGNRAVFDAPSIEEIFLEAADGRGLPNLADQLKILTVLDAKGVHSINPSGPLPQLETLEISGSSSFDLGSLRRFPQLRRASFNRVRRLVNADALHASLLQALGILGCGAIDRPESLARIAGADVLIVGKLADQFRGIDTNPASRWDLRKRL